MTPHGLKLSHAYLLLACLAVSPAFAQASAAVVAGSLAGHAQAGPVEKNDRIARGPRTDDTRYCDMRGVTVHSANGSSSASANVTPGGSSAVAGSGAPGPSSEYFGCEASQKRSTR
jgi:hypothetical protein